MSITRSEFFERVLPTTGHLCLVGIMADGSAPINSKFYPIEDAYNGALDNRINELLGEKREVYFGCATFKDPRGQRTAKNAAGYKCFRADIDCGPGKPYPSQKDGLLALQKYLEETGLPMPTLVNSGRGWHIYWTLDEVIDYNTWRPMADALKKSMADLEFGADPSVTADGARILRIPGTYNHKDITNPKPVAVIKAADSIQLAQFRNLLRPYMADAPLDGMEGFAHAVAGADDPLMRKVLQSSEKVFSKILSRSLRQTEVTETVEVVSENNGKRTTKQQKQKVMRSAGCAQIAYIYNEQADENFNYDLWRAGLSIARNCADWETAIHDISRAYPEYDPRETVVKAEDTFDKPQKCSQFQSINPSLCLTCPLKGQITTPIMLGLTITPAEPLDNVQEQVWHQGLKEHTHVDIPIDYPKPWFRPKLGGVALHGLSGGDGDDGEADTTVMIYENDIWVQKILNDPNHGAMLQIARILPKDGMKEFTIPLSFVYKKDKCSEFLGYHHVAVQPALMPKMQKYLVDWVKFIQPQREAEEAREQFGWHDNDTKFLIGGREIRSDGTVVFSPPCSTTEEIVSLYMAKGELDAWRTVINTYGKPGNEARAFVLFAHMGTPLYKFFNVNSMLVHLTNSASGVGKTTCQMSGASVWGHPKATMLTEHDTALSRQQRCGILKNLPVDVDEITNFAGDEASDFVFRFSDDRGRNRLHSQMNVERKNNVSWQTVGFTSGNNSLYDTLRTNKQSAQGEMFRVMEVEIMQDTSLTKKESDYLFNHLLRDNYGMAGEILMKHVVPNREEVVKAALREQEAFDKAAGFNQQARNYSALCGSAFAMARIAKNLGLHDIDVEKVRDWAIQAFGVIHDTITKGSTSDTNNVLGEFLNQNGRNVLVINDRDQLDDPTLPIQPMREPYGELVIRYEPNTRKVFIARDKLRAWCSERRIPYTPMLQKMKASGIDNHSMRICLSRGTSMPGSAVWVECFDADTLGWHVDIHNQSE